MFTRSAANFIMIGVTLNMAQLFGDVYSTVSISVLLEFPGYLAIWFGLERIGRKPTLTMTMLAILGCCIAAMSLQFYSSEYINLKFWSVLLLCPVPYFINHDL